MERKSILKAKNLKTKKRKSEQALDQLLSLRGVTYEWNDDKTGIDRPETTQYGFIAQEIQEVFPEKVEADSQGYLQTAYGDYDAMIVQSMKALLERIERLEQENKELKAKMTQLPANADAASAR